MIFFDNCPAHNRAEDLLTDFPNVLAKRLPPYSSKLNAVEMMFSFYKARIKRELRFLGQVESYQRHVETLAACCARILVESATKAVDVVTRSSVGRCAGRVFRNGIPRIS